MIPFRLFVFALAVYSSLPALVTGFAAAGEYSVYAGGLMALLQGGGVLLVFRRSSSRYAFTLLSVLGLAVSAIAIAGGIYIDAAFLGFLMKLYPGPLLAVSYSLVYRFARRRDFNRLARGLNLIILVLGSYSALLVILQLHQFITVGMAVQELDAVFIGVYESLSYIPALLLLVILRGGSENDVLSAGERILFRDEDVSDLFSDLQQAILKGCIQSRDRKVFCRDFAYLTPGAEHCVPGGECKASQCPAYAVIYRNISALSGKLENLGIGRLVPPANKRDITSEGWLLELEEGIVTATEKKSLFFAGLIPAKLDSTQAAEQTRIRGNSWFTVFQRGMPFFAAFAGSFLIISELSRMNAAASGILLPWAVFEALFMLGSLTVSRGTSLKIVFALSLAGIVFLPFLLIPGITELAAFSFALKNMAVFTILQLLRFPALEGDRNPERLRRLLSGSIFWLIWFYMVMLVAFPGPVLSGSMVFAVLDRLLLVLLFAGALIFHSLRPKNLLVKDDEVYFEGRRLESGLSEANMRILSGFLSAPEGVLLCGDISALIGDGKDSCGDGGCKPSMCRRYQSIYKRIQVLRRHLETAGIGTIISPDRKPDSYTQGWRFAPYEDVLIRRNQESLISL